MKKYLNEALHLALCLLVLITAGCGYVSDKPIQDTVNRQEMQTCKIDPAKLAEIFKKDQREQIRCIQENFVQFTKYVRTNSAGSVNETDLNEFIRKFFQGQSETIVKGLSVIFQLNMILLKDEADSISKGNISPLFDLSKS
jgi:flagellar motor component MotA